MKIHLAPIALLAFGLALGCSSEASEAGSQAASPSTGEPSQPAAAAPVENLDAVSAARLLAQNSDVVVLDIRTPAEYEGGHLKGAVNIDYRAEDFAEKLAALDKEKTYLVH